MKKIWLALVLFAAACSDAPPANIDVTCEVFPKDNWWNQDISDFPLHPRSTTYLQSIGLDRNLHPDFGTKFQGAPIGIPFSTATLETQRFDVEFDFEDESDAGPYPIPVGAPIESSGDRHLLVVDNDSCLLYELYLAQKKGSKWTAGSGAVFDLSSNDLRTLGHTSADAAGLPIFPGLVRYDEVVVEGAINHALRFTVSQTQNGFVEPARHAAGRNDSNLPPMGLRLRMKNAFDCSQFSKETQIVCAALKRYGMFVADNGSNWYISGAPDSRWSDKKLGDIKKIPGSAFEAVETGPITLAD